MQALCSDEAPGPLRARDLLRIATSRDDDAFAREVGEWVLIGGDPRDAADEEWSFRTHSVAMAHEIVAEREILVHDRTLVHRLRKAKAGPFARTILVGRSSTNDVCIAHPSVSKLHARLERSPSGALLLSDAGSSNGTFHQRRRLDDAARVTLSVGERVRFGACTFQLLDAGRLRSMICRLA